MAEAVGNGGAGGGDVSPNAKAPVQSSAATVLGTILGALVLSVVPLAVYLVLVGSLDERHGEGRAARHKNVEEVHLPVRMVTVNLRDPSGSRIFRLGAELVLSNEVLAEDLRKSGTALLADCIMAVAARKSVAQLETPEGRKSLKRELLRELNASIHGRAPGAIMDLYFTEFVIY